MKKSLVLGAAVAAMSISTAASAINTQAYRGSFAPMVSDGVGTVGRVYSILATPVGASTEQCAYRLQWANPNNTLDVATCELRELRGSVNASCIANAGANIDATVLGGGAVGVNCNGYGLFGEPLQGISLFLTEIAGASPGSALRGMWFHQNVGFLPIQF